MVIVIEVKHIKHTWNLAVGRRQEIMSKRRRRRNYSRKNFKNLSQNLESAIKYDVWHKLQSPTAGI